MPPTTNSRGKKQQTNTSSTGYPGLKPNDEAPPKSQYEEAQEEEIYALGSIYGDDFRMIEKTQGAWKKSEPSFEIRIRTPDDETAITLCVTFTATYPKTAPLLSIKGDGGLGESTRFKIQKVLETKPKELISEEQAMVMEIVIACQDILDDAAQAKAAGLKLPSLEEERAAHEAAANQLAEIQRKEEERKKNLESQEEERMLGSLVQEELKRQKTKAKETRRKTHPPTITLPQTSSGVSGSSSLHDTLAFDQPIHIDAGNPLVFQVVVGRVLVRRGPVSQVYTVRPVADGVIENNPTLVLKQTALDTDPKDHSFFKKQLQSLEIELESLKKVRHQNILDFFDFKVHKTTDNGDLESAWTVSILTGYAEKGSLEEFLDIAENLSITKVRSWTIELLDALRFLHDHGIIHGDIHSRNVLLVRESSGEVRPKLADAGYQRKLYGLGGRKRATDSISVAKSAYWFAPETANNNEPQLTQKTDIWDFGILFLQMVFGLTVVRKYSSPMSMADSLALSTSLAEFLSKIFKENPKKRPRAVDLGSFEFLATDAPILDEYNSHTTSRLGSITSLMPPTPHRQRHDSMTTGGPFSRYKEDFVEEGRLGRGGFGEVVKARKKLDGQIYAIKKITQKSTASLTEVLKEVRLLSQLSHPSVVRYYNTWTEEVADSSELTETDTDVTTEDATTEDSTSELSPEKFNPSGDLGLNIEFGESTGGLDFMSNSGYPQVEFGLDNDSESDEDDEKNNYLDDKSTSASANFGSNHLELGRTKSSTRHQRPAFKTVLYISMEYCEKRTLRDLIKRGLSKESEEIWRLFRQILEGLAHIHGLNVVHRDLKPENIFIDAASNVKIGDFGLATSGQYVMTEKLTSTPSMGGDMTRSIGTAFYVAPEVKSNVGGNYSSKVDMYSLGIIFFEMCYPAIVGMERVQVIEALRNKQPLFPKDFDTAGKAVQVDIILSLLSHSPKDRPTSSELLQSGKLPVQMESETIRQTLSGLADPKSPYYHKMMGALFSRPTKQAKDFAWDMGSVNPTADDLLLQGIVKQKLISIFRHHGAVETSRSALFPRSGHYGPDAVQLLDPNGTLVQMPYDLTLSHARAIAKHEPSVERSFAFGPVFRDRQSGGQPQTFGEVDFDIVSVDSLDLALKEAEVIKVLDEIVASFPSLSSAQMCFHLSHSDLLNLIFDFCRIEFGIRQQVSDTLSKLNIQQWTWQKIKAELRSPHVGVSATSVEDLQRFDFRDTPTKAFQKLKTIFEGTDIFDKAASTIAHLKDVLDYIKRFEVRCKVYINPLGSLKEKFCKGGVVFSCLYDRNNRVVFAAGGRYDSLIREHRHKAGGGHSEERYAVGFNLAWEKMARLPKTSGKGFLKKPEEELQGIWTTKRCDILVASHDPAILRTTGIDIVQQLWAHEMSAELAQDSRSPEDLLFKYRESQYLWIIIVKQDSILKIKTMRNKEVQDVEIPSTQLMAWLLAETRDRDPRDSTFQRARLQRHHSEGNTTTHEHDQNVQVLFAGTKSKKSNRRNIVEQAQGRATTLVQSFLDGPIAAIETTDHIMELLRETRLSDGETWRKIMHAAPMTERRYLGEVHEMMLGMRGAEGQGEEGTRNAFIYNFRTGMCIYYDLGA